MGTKFPTKDPLEWTDEEINAAVKSLKKTEKWQYFQDATAEPKIREAIESELETLRRNAELIRAGKGEHILTSAGGGSLSWYWASYCSTAERRVEHLELMLTAMAIG